MREFTNPTYDGKKCACCKPTIDNAANLLLDDNLVWDADFEAIREDLGQLLISIDPLKRGVILCQHACRTCEQN